MAKEMVANGYVHFEADMFFTVDGTYTYNPVRIQEAHAWCQRMTRQALKEGRRVVVSNTFTRLREMEPYQCMVDRIRVLEACGRWQKHPRRPSRNSRQDGAALGATASERLGLN